MDGNGRGGSCFTGLTEVLKWSWKFAYGGQLMVEYLDFMIVRCWFDGHGWRWKF